MMKTLEPLSLKLVRTVVLFPKVSLLLPAETASDLERPCVWLSYLPNPKAWPLNLQSKKPSIAFWIIFGNDCKKAWTLPQSWTVLPDQRVVMVLSAHKVLNKLWGVRILLSSLRWCPNWGKQRNYFMLKPPQVVLKCLSLSIGSWAA